MLRSRRQICKTTITTRWLVMSTINFFSLTLKLVACFYFTIIVNNFNVARILLRLEKRTRLLKSSAPPHPSRTLNFSGWHHQGFPSLPTFSFSDVLLWASPFSRSLMCTCNDIVYTFQLMFIIISCIRAYISVHDFSYCLHVHHIVYTFRPVFMCREYVAILVYALL